jgi:hypothetical protein
LRKTPGIVYHPLSANLFFRPDPPPESGPKRYGESIPAQASLPGEPGKRTHSFSAQEDGKLNQFAAKGKPPEW